jgi:hypothetical protein
MFVASGVTTSIPEILQLSTVLRETRERRWPMLPVETKANGDSKNAN